MPVIHQATIMAVAGGLRESCLLTRIVFWARYAKVERGGHVWIVKTQEEWSGETGLSLYQVRRAFHALRHRGVVDTEQHLFGSYKAINYTRLLPAAEAALGLTAQDHAE